MITLVYQGIKNEFLEDITEKQKHQTKLLLMISFRRRKQKWDTLSGEELFRKYKETKDRECFGEIYKRYSKMVYGVCLKYTKDKNDAKDAMMDVFEMLMKKIPEQEKITSIDYWLFSVTRNKCMTRLRRTQKEPNGILDEKYVEKKSDFHMENEGFLRLTNEGIPKQNKIVMEAMKQLSPEQKACIEAFYVNNLSYKQIEEHLGYPLVKVKSHLQNGKRNLKRFLLQKTQTET